MKRQRVLTDKEQETNMETQAHIANVQAYIKIFVELLTDRGANHDATKLCDPEVKLFTEITHKLAGCTYGSDEYNEFLKQLKPALDHHYAKNRHHPEHFPKGVDDMTLVDLLELFADWKAATLRHDNGNLLKSIEINSKRFNIGEQLTNVFRNTAELIDHKKV